MDRFDSEIVSKFYSEIESDKYHRYKSWEHCYSAFLKYEEFDYLGLHLAFYLASWGMYRGSSGLLQKDYKIHNEAVKIIKSKRYDDIRAYDSEIVRSDIPDILELFNELSDYYKSISYIRKGKYATITPTDTLITKIILGAVGSVPAYDRFFRFGLSKFEITKTFGKASLNGIFDFIEYGGNKQLIESTIDELKTKDIKYPKMKIIDMYFWSLGEQRSNRQL